MLRSLKDLEGYLISATDGEIGSVANFLFDDQRWAIRYLVAETGGSLGGRRVLISPSSFRKADWSTRDFHVALTIDSVKDSPNIDTDRPVCRQHEQNDFSYYGYPACWGYAGVWGMVADPDLLSEDTWNEVPAPQSHQPDDMHLRSARHVRGYHIQGSDGPIGHVADFLVDDETWELRYLVVDTKKWWFGKKVLVSPHWAKRISWQEEKIHLDLTRDAIQRIPEWSPSASINREYEPRRYDSCGRPVDWEDCARPVDAPTQHDSASR